MGLIGQAVGITLGALIGGFLGNLLPFSGTLGMFLTTVAVVAGGLFGHKAISPRIPI